MNRALQLGEAMTDGGCASPFVYYDCRANDEALATAIAEAQAREGPPHEKRRRRPKSSFARDNNSNNPAAAALEDLLLLPSGLLARARNHPNDDDGSDCSHSTSSSSSYVKNVLNTAKNPRFASKADKVVVTVPVVPVGASDEVKGNDEVVLLASVLPMPKTSTNTDHDASQQSRRATRAAAKKWRQAKQRARAIAAAEELITQARGTTPVPTEQKNADETLVDQEKDDDDEDENLSLDEYQELAAAFKTHHNANDSTVGMASGRTIAAIDPPEGCETILAKQHSHDGSCSTMSNSQAVELAPELLQLAQNLQALQDQHKNHRARLYQQKLWHQQRKVRAKSPKNAAPTTAEEPLPSPPTTPTATTAAAPTAEVPTTTTLEPPGSHGSPNDAIHYHTVPIASYQMTFPTTERRDDSDAARHFRTVAIEA